VSTTGGLLGLAAVLLATAVSFSIYVLGVLSKDRSISRVAAPVFCVCAAVTIWMLVRVLL
jgi:hypothetical protein